MKDQIKRIVEMLKPRFFSEAVFVKQIGPDYERWECYEVLGTMDDQEIDPREADGIAAVDCFEWMGFGLAYRVRDFLPMSDTFIFAGDGPGGSQCAR